MRPVQDKKYQRLLCGAAEKGNAMHSGGSYVFCQKKVPPGCSFLQMRYKIVSHFPGVSAPFAPSGCSGHRSIKSFKTNHLLGCDSLTLPGEGSSALRHSVTSAGWPWLAAWLFFAAINNLILPVLVPPCHLRSQIQFCTVYGTQKKKVKKGLIFFSFSNIYLPQQHGENQPARQGELFSFSSVAAVVPAEKLMRQYILCCKLYTAHQTPLKRCEFFSRGTECLPALTEVNRNYNLQDLCYRDLLWLLLTLVRGAVWHRTSPSGEKWDAKIIRYV